MLKISFNINSNMYNLLEYPLKNYVDVLNKEFKIKKTPINKYIKKQKWSFDVELGNYPLKLAVDNQGNKYAIIDENFAIKIIK